MHRLNALLLSAVLAALIAPQPVTAQPDERPNIVWVVVEDQSRHYGCYGEALVTTPRIDAMAAAGVKFSNAVTTAPVCSTARSALITGMYQTSIGAHHHRSGRGTEKMRLPEHVKLIPRYFQEAGYYTSIGSIDNVRGDARRPERLGKTDYNFEWDESVYDGSDWSERASGQPFFAQVMLAGGKARAQARRDGGIPHVDPQNVVLPPYYPRDPVILEDWAAYLDTFTLMDVQVGDLLDRLERENALDNTVIFFMTDHGVSHARGKQFLYDEGIMIPLIVYGPGRFAGGEVREDLILQIDVAATSLDLAGIPVPAYMEGRTLFGPSAQPRDYVVSARDRCDETHDRIRCVRTHDLKYIRNFHPERPHLQPNAYKDNKEIYQALRSLHAKGELNELQEQLLFSPRRAREELYDLQSDPWELTNLADDPAYAGKLASMRQTLDEWIERTGDRGEQLEPMSMYDSDMEVYLDGIRKKRPDRYEEIKGNIALMKKWRDEGK